MSKVCIPQGYKTPLSVYEMQRAIEFIKSNFQVNLGNAPPSSTQGPNMTPFCVK